MLIFLPAGRESFIGNKRKPQGVYIPFLKKAISCGDAIRQEKEFGLLWAINGGKVNMWRKPRDNQDYFSKFC